MTTLPVAITRIDPTLPLPVYQITGAAAFDLTTRETTVIAPRALDSALK